MARKMKRQTKARSKSRAKAKAPQALRRRVAAKAARPRARAVRKPATVRAKGLQSMAAGITANDAAASIKWYCDVLGFSLKERWENEGTFLGGSVVNGGVTFNIGQDDWKLGRDRKKGQGVRFFMTTADDIDAYAKGITSQGQTLEHEPKDEWGFRAFSVADPDGYKLTFLRPLK
jgi:catechol 2,3-dioxygenase-like lactoylglutathione lyase family enzyme